MCLPHPHAAGWVSGHVRFSRSCVSLPCTPFDVGSRKSRLCWAGALAVSLRTEKHTTIACCLCFQDMRQARHRPRHWCGLHRQGLGDLHQRAGMCERPLQGRTPHLNLCCRIAHEIAHSCEGMGQRANMLPCGQCVLLFRTQCESLSSSGVVDPTQGRDATGICAKSVNSTDTVRACGFVIGGNRWPSGTACDHSGSSAD